MTDTVLTKTVEAVLLGVGAYLGVGAVFVVAFQAWGLRRCDPAVSGAGWFFRALITPGVVALWPVLAVKWRRAARGGEFQGAANRPVSAERLRARHFLWWKLLVVLVPLAVAAALYGRPAGDEGTSHQQQIPTNLQDSKPKPTLHAPALGVGFWNFPGPWSLVL